MATGSSGAVKVEGLRELQRALSKYDKELRRDVTREMKGAAKIVATAARDKLNELSPTASARTIGGVRPRVRGSVAFVEQRLGKTTGKRGDWGTTQMSKAFLPARAEKTDEVVAALDGMLDRLASRNGF